VSSRPSTVVVDTNVFGADLVRSTRPLVDLYEPLLAGRRYVVSFQTVAELEFGFRRAAWGEDRFRRARDHIRRAEVVWPGPELLEAAVVLRVACDRSGHPLAQRRHDADRWIAATAIHLGIPLVSHDGVFRDAPGLALETMLAR
jgi:predicted nucleic acid-binding protein